MYDQVFFKLDAAEENVANRVDCNKRHIDKIIADIKKVSDLIRTGIFTLKNLEISTAVVGSEIGNYDSLFRKKFISTIQMLNPQKILTELRLERNLILLLTKKSFTS